MYIVIRIINGLVSILTLVIFIYSLLSFFLGAYHPIRQTLAKIIEPMLAPIRRVVTPVGGIDFSPLILIILLQVIGAILIAVLRGFS